MPLKTKKTVATLHRNQHKTKQLRGDGIKDVIKGVEGFLHSKIFHSVVKPIAIHAFKQGQKKYRADKAKQFKGNGVKTSGVGHIGGGVRLAGKRRQRGRGKKKCRK